jgi:hypothetical protein
MNCVLHLPIIHEEFQILARQSLQPRCTSFPMSPIPTCAPFFYFISPINLYMFRLLYEYVKGKELGGEWFGWQ